MFSFGNKNIMFVGGATCILDGSELSFKSLIELSMISELKLNMDKTKV